MRVCEMSLCSPTAQTFMHVAGVSASRVQSRIVSLRASFGFGRSGYAQQALWVQLFFRITLKPLKMFFTDFLLSPQLWS